MYSLFANVFVSATQSSNLDDVDMSSDKQTSEVIAYVDIKSPGLRDILRVVLKDTRTAVLEANKPTVL